MGKYAVSLFLRDVEDKVTDGVLKTCHKERLLLQIVKARTATEALGLFIGDKNREYYGYPIVYHVVKEVK